MKIIAFYLPQFHRIPENDRWWGEGFTEWTNTRKAKPLFLGHYQPREPYQDFYYDLSDPVASKWQAFIAKKYGIYGFCYYHYWFKGKRLLETPFNEVLRTGEPDFPFCLSWANEPWTRRWDGMEHDILMPQDYGDENDWKVHFEYLLQAFLDKRYIRLDNRPIFLIYRPASIPRCQEMLIFWDTLAKKSGLDGIFFVETLNSFPQADIKGFSGCVEFEPLYTCAHDMPENAWKEVKAFNTNFRMNVLNYDRIWERILSRNVNRGDKQTFLGAFVDWDNSARKGYNAGIFEGASPEKFFNYLCKQIERARTIYKSDFLFVNAWNEWAEGAYLEPDKKYGFRYLQMVKKALDPVSIASDCPDGILLKGSSSAVYLVENGQKRPFVDPHSFLFFKFQWNHIIHVDDSTLDLFPTGTPIDYSKPFPEYSPNTLLAKGSGPTVYLFKNATRYPFSSETIFQRLGYDFAEVIYLPDSLLNSFPSGSPITDKEFEI